MGAHHQHTKTGDSTTNLRLAFVLNVSFTLIEIVGGWYTNSVAILSDAIHDLGDSIAIGSALFLEKNLQKPLHLNSRMAINACPYSAP